jgi:hypothetical protein
MLVSPKAKFNRNLIEHIQDKVFWISLGNSVRNLKTFLSFYKSLYGFSTVLNFVLDIQNPGISLSVKLCGDLIARLPG